MAAFTRRAVVGAQLAIGAAAALAVASPASALDPVLVPPPGAIVFGAPAGRNAVWFSARPGSAGIRLRASVVNGSGDGVGGLQVRFAVDVGTGLHTARGLSCGRGCYRAQVRALGRPVRFVAWIGAVRVAFAAPTVWPPQPARALVLRASTTWRTLRTLVFHDVLAAGTGVAVHTTWTLVAPDRLTYRINGGNAAVIIGNRRWDRSPGGPWRASAQTPIRQPKPPWVSVRNAHLLAERVRGGRHELMLSFFDPGSPASFRIVVDRTTHRTLDMQMIAPAHFMRDVYGPFNGAVSIVPPRPSSG
jgi:hypothetical protein